MKHKKKTNHDKKTKSTKSIIILFIIYLLIFITIFSFINLYADFIINMYILTIIAVVVAGLSTYFHVRSGVKTRIDDFADKL